MLFFLWEVKPCSLVEMKGLFRENWCLLHKDREMWGIIRNVGHFCNTSLHDALEDRSLQLTLVCTNWYGLQFIGDLSVAHTYLKNTHFYAVVSPQWRYVTSLFISRRFHHVCRKIINYHIDMAYSLLETCLSLILTKTVPFCRQWKALNGATLHIFHCQMPQTLL